MWERRRERKALEAERRREFLLAVGGREQLERLIAGRLEDWLRVGTGDRVPANVFKRQAATVAADCTAAWAQDVDGCASTPPVEYVERRIAELITTLEQSPLVRFTAKNR